MGRYYVQTSDGLIVGAPTAPTLDTPPTGATTQVIPDVEGARIGGTWVDPDYTPPPGQSGPYDTSTIVGQMKAAAYAQRVRVCELAEQLKANEHLFGAPDYDLAKDFLAYTLWGSRAVFMSADLGEGDKLLWAAGQRVRPGGP